MQEERWSARGKSDGVQEERWRECKGKYGRGEKEESKRREERSTRGEEEGGGGKWEGSERGKRVGLYEGGGGEWSARAMTE